MMYYAIVKKLALQCGILILLVLADVLSAADILAEWGWTRLVSGDRAVWLTREVDVTPQAAEITSTVLVQILSNAGLNDLPEYQLIAWQRGLKMWGWVQQENEPEQEAYLVIRLVSVSQPEKKILMQRYTPYGNTHHSWYDFQGRQLASENLQIDATLDRSVFHTVRSPSLFVLNQEHFQKHFFEGMLDLTYPGLEAAKKAYEQKKTLASC